MSTQLPPAGWGARQGSERDDALACNTADFWHISGHRDVIARLEQGEELAQGLNAAALPHLVGALRARATHDAHAEFLGSDCVDRAIAVAGDHHMDAILRAKPEGLHEVLAMPHRDDDRAIFQPTIAIGGHHRHGARALDETQIARKKRAQEKLDGFTPPDRFQHGRTMEGRRRSGLIASRIGIEKAMQMHHEIAHLRIVDGRLRLGLPGSMGGSVIRVDADDIELRQILESCAVDFGQLAAENEVEQLRFGIRRGHNGISRCVRPGKAEAPARNDQPRFAAERLPVKSEGISRSIRPILPARSAGCSSPVNV